ncbi:MAG TPA: mechanosensitive ion channel protein [Bdellovibrionales bacterium]|nr:mechanosensitive ion channel protein [Pseudobdellovibrionaceae bacterium]HAG92268.1 mechanosensitive ion channel protein [Bdellovibrionales bacterium]|tara:strand:+ start:10470 stop:11291 length:822 start_codon:yes stop_codon:yes gene_type:complete
MSDTPDFSHLSGLSELFGFQKILFLIIGFGALILILRGLSHFAGSLNQRFPSRRILISQILTILNFSVYIFGSFALVFGILNPPKELLIAAGGSLAVAVGLSLKDLVASVIAGLTLLFDRPFQVGDRVTFGDIYGEIQSIGLRAVRLVTLDDNLVTIPNSKFVTEAVASGNAGALDMMVVIDFHVALHANIEQARKIIFETIVTSRFVYLKKPVNIVISESNFSNRMAIQLKAKAYVLDVRFEKAFQSDVVTRVSERFYTEEVQRPDFVVSQS